MFEEVGASWTYAKSFISANLNKTVLECGSVKSHKHD